ncbi:glycosyltransferase family 4 protein [Tardiphaga robiniae]|uniref:glycosyltransferase family 4 protein n=1 Tax=Tardiphaga robiniae TaxID=943830 RepID=UPI00195DE959|nr:glycosyltransferase family 1 protein [Tardiphaga robiniae]
MKQISRTQQVALQADDTKELRTIVVDLTPVLPGGENGGAKVFVLELLRRLAERAPQTQFVLLTQAAAHEELAALDRENVRRLMVLDLSNPPALRSLANRISSRLLRYLPERPRRIAQRSLNRLKPMLRRNAQSAIVRELSADLLFCPFTAPTYFEMTIPTVSVIYDLQYKTYPEFFPAADVAQRDRTFIDAARRSTMLVSISEYSRQVAIKYGKLDPAQIRTVHLHISQHSLRNAARDEAVLDRLQLTPGQYLIYPANFWKHKNHEMLLTAFGIARSNGLDNNIRLVCTGAPGARQQWLKEAAEGFGLGNYVLFPGYLANAELLTLITNSVGVIFPSLYEGFGLPVIEAMATGVPVACSNVTSLPEVAGDAAILFDPRVPDDIARALTALAHDKELTSRLVRAGELRATQFSDSKLMAEQYWEAFQHAAGLEFKPNLLVGVYPDGWVGPNPKVQVSSSTQNRTLNLEILVPDWAPVSKVRMRICQDGNIKSEITVPRGKDGRLSVPMSVTGGSFDIELAPAFIPALTGAGDDQRELAAILKKCEIVGSDGSFISLFPESTST